MLQLVNTKHYGQYLALNLHTLFQLNRNNFSNVWGPYQRNQVLNTKINN